MFSLSQEVFIFSGKKKIIWPLYSCLFCCLFCVMLFSFCMMTHFGFSHGLFIVFFKFIRSPAIKVPLMTLSFRNMSQELCHTCPLGKPQLHHNRLCPQKKERSGGNRARLITWEQILLITSRENLTLTYNRSTAISPWTHPRLRHISDTYSMWSWLKSLFQLLEAFTIPHQMRVWAGQKMRNGQMLWSSNSVIWISSV